MPIQEHPVMHLEAQAGGQLVVELQSMPGAGLVWAAPELPPGCSITALENRPVSEGIGGPAMQRFQVSCDRPGRIQLRFVLKRPWERETRAVQDVEIVTK